MLIVQTFFCFINFSNVRILSHSSDIRYTLNVFIRNAKHSKKVLCLQTSSVPPLRVETGLLVTMVSLDIRVRVLLGLPVSTV